MDEVSLQREHSLARMYKRTNLELYITILIVSTCSVKRNP
jgi:hypothetical protein